jgi:GTP diphosphokinase / guanosine-3',5'-bis(diphosphate) 3'-diphosphatase
MEHLEAILSALSSTDVADRSLVEKAYAFAKEAHKDHKRFSGEPYLSHLEAVALMLAEMGMGAKTVAAGLLHDVIEDTSKTAEEVQTQFGDEVLFLVEGVTKLGSVRYHGTDRHNESLRKLFVATSEDIRVVIIKLVDRLHNMQTLKHVPEEKRLRIARETLEIYVPVAHRLGMGRIRKELEDLAFPYVFPEEYERVQKLAKPRLKHAEDQLDKAQKTLQKKLAEEKIVAEFKTNSRIKGMYSLYTKLSRKEWDPTLIYDLLAIRVIVPSVEECYRVLGIVHSLFRPLPGRVKDYIAFPKPNGYQSIHTTVITGKQEIMEVQIRTETMHRESEFGVASHLAYKQRQKEDGELSPAQSRLWVTGLIPSLFRPFSWRLRRRDDTQKPPPETATAKEITHRYGKDQVPRWIQEIGEAHLESEDTGDFMNELKQDFFVHRIFAFTPKGDVIDLPVGATPLDFAYAIHSDIGDRTSVAKVNNKTVSLGSTLSNGDIVEIITKKSSKPTAKWLEFAKTSMAQRRIRGALGMTSHGDYKAKSAE